MNGPAELRKQAKSKRDSAELARQLGPSVSSGENRRAMFQLAEKYEAEASGLEAQADAVDRSAES